MAASNEGTPSVGNNNQPDIIDQAVDHLDHLDHLSEAEIIEHQKQIIEAAGEAAAESVIDFKPSDPNAGSAAAEVATPKSQFENPVPTPEPAKPEAQPGRGNSSKEKQPEKIELTPEQKLAFATRDLRATRSAYEHDIARSKEKFLNATAVKSGGIEKPPTAEELTKLSPEDRKATEDRLAEQRAVLEELAQEEARNQGYESVEDFAAKEVAKTSVAADYESAKQIFHEQAVEVASKDRNYITTQAQIDAMSSKFATDKSEITSNKFLTRDEKANKIKELNEAHQSQIARLTERRDAIVYEVEIKSADNFRAHRKELIDIDAKTGNIANPGDSKSELAGNYNGVGSWRELLPTQSNAENNPPINETPVESEQSSSEEQPQTETQSPETSSASESDVDPEYVPIPIDQSLVPVGERSPALVVNKGREFTEEELKSINDREKALWNASDNLAEQTARLRGVFNKRQNQEAYDAALAQYTEARNAHINDQLELYKSDLLNDNPDITDAEFDARAQAEMFRQFTKEQKDLNTDICDHIDGEAEGLNRATKFVRKWGAFWDKHPKLKVVAGIGTAFSIGALTGGLGLAAVPSVLSAMTLAGAQSAIWSRSGSKKTSFNAESSANTFELSDINNPETVQQAQQRTRELLNSGELTNQQSATIQAIGEFLNRHNSANATAEHAANVKKTRKGIITAVIISGAVNGATQFLRSDMGHELIDKAKDWFTPDKVGATPPTGTEAVAANTTESVTSVSLPTDVPPPPVLETFAHLNVDTAVTRGMGTMEFLGNAGFTPDQVTTILSNPTFAEEAIKTGFGYSMNTLGGVGINVGTTAGPEIIKFASTLI